MSRLNRKRKASCEREEDKERYRKVCLERSVAKTLLTLDRQNWWIERGKRSSQSSFKSERTASDEFRRANQIIKNVVQPKRRRHVKTVNSLQKNGLGISKLKIINSSKAVASPFRNLDPLAKPFFSTAEVNPLTRFQVSARWNPPFL